MRPGGRLGEPELWALLTALAARAKTEPLVTPCGVWLDREGALAVGSAEVGWLFVEPHRERGQLRVPAAPEAHPLLELYLPLVLGAQAEHLVLGHVGQSLDGNIATAAGASRWVTGPEDILHLHRLRALFDAVIIGARTAEADDPQLTTRLVVGKNPTRVVLDPELRLSPFLRVFSDGAAPTLAVCARGRARGRARLGLAEVVEVPTDGGALPPEGIVAALRQRGLTRLFVEGGGVTLSRFLAARALERVHITVSPFFLGEGRPGLRLPAVERLEDVHRPRTRRFQLGDDVLFECRFEPRAAGA